MIRVEYSTVIDAPAESVWALARDFGALPKWFFFVSRSALEGGAAADQIGAVRANTVPESVIRERLLEMSEPDRCIIYSILDGPGPTRDYAAKLQVLEVTDGDRSLVNWSAEFKTDGDASQSEEWVREMIFATCLMSLAKLVSPCRSSGLHSTSTCSAGCSRASPHLTLASPRRGD